MNWKNKKVWVINEYVAHGIMAVVWAGMFGTQIIILGLVDEET